MKRYLKAVISAICILAALLSFGACDKKEEEGKSTTSSTEYYTVSFNTKGGSAIASISVPANDNVEQPDDPTLEGMVFHRWTYEGRIWDFHFAKVTGDMTLDAEWIDADRIFNLDTVVGLDGIAIAGIRLQKEFHTLKVPSVINGLTVTAIADDAFQSGLLAEHAETIIFPDTLTYVGEYAFKDKSAVQLVFTGKLTYVGESAFENCSAFENISLAPSMEEIAYRSFASCTALKYIDIPSGVKAIKENAFDACTSMSYVVLPATLTSIENGAFDECSSLKAVFFGGDEEGYKKIEIERGNAAIEDAKVYFYSEDKPQESGKYWHYDKTGAPTLWD